MKIKFLVLIVLLFLFSSGCTSKEIVPAAENTSLATESLSSSKEVREIVDQLGRTVELPEKIERIATDRILPFPSVYFLATGSTEQIVGMHPASKSAAENSMLAKLSPSVLKAQTGFMKGEEINIEELLKLNTDIVFIHGDGANKTDIYDKANIKTIGIKTTSIANGNAIETLNSWLELLGEMYHNQDRAKEIISYGRQVEKEIGEKIQGYEDKPKALMIFNHTDGKTIVSGKGFFGNYWLNATGAIDVAEKDITMNGPVDMEQIYQWNPEIIYVTNFTELQPEDFYNNTIEGQDWSQVDAVKNKRVYKIPLGIYRWFPPSGDSPLMLQWLAQKNLPDLFTYDIKEIIRDYYRQYYDYDLTDAEVEGILHPSREAAQGV
ncbi:MAG: ABC transporter substrate-binding protein [Thermotaleaceae bacterium]